MSGSKCSSRGILSAGAALLLMVPSLALGEFGVCPPYSKTFGPSDYVTNDANAEIVAFIREINSRPGGGTLVLEPGAYYDPGSYYDPGPSVIAHVPISGVVCIRSSVAATVPASENRHSVSLFMELPVDPGGMLTLRDVYLHGRGDRAEWREQNWTSVSAGGTLFAEHVRLHGTEPYYNISVGFANAGFAYLRDTWIGSSDSVTGAVIENTGTLVMEGGGVSTASLFSFDALRNLGYANLDRVSISRNCGESFGATRGIVNYSGSVLNMANSVVARNGYGCPSRDPLGDVVGVRNESGGFAHIVSSTVANNVVFDDSGEPQSATGISNDGLLELEKSIVTDACGPVTDRGYNVGTCAATQPTSIEADPLFIDQSGGYSIELGAGSPAIDRIPLDLCSETDAQGRARTDGNGDGIVACDVGALEYGYAFVEATIRARPYHWREVGTIDLSTTDLMTIYVFSTATFDATQIDFESVAIEGFEDDAKGWPWTIDVGKDGLVDYQVTWWLNRQPPLPCGYQEHRFSAMTLDGTQVRGLLKFEAVGCAP